MHDISPLLEKNIPVSARPDTIENNNNSNRPDNGAENGAENGVENGSIINEKSVSSGSSVIHPGVTVFLGVLVVAVFRWWK